MFRPASLSIVCAVVVTATTLASEQKSQKPKPIPPTRPEIKVALEALKDRVPRLPLPDSGEAGGVNNGRMRAHYLPETWNARGKSRRSRGRGGRNSQTLLGYPLTVSCFWIASRGNNCQYCLGHQELKLRSAGLDDDSIAALDSDWSRFDPRKQAALHFARRMTLEPWSLDDTDIAKMQAVFSGAEIIELTYNIARYNSTNRWTDGLGLPQDRRFHDGASTLVTETSPEFQNTKSLVTPDTRMPRPAAAPLTTALHEIESARSRTARVELSSQGVADRALDEAASDRSPYNWERAMSPLGSTGVAQVRTWNTILADDNLPPRLKAELAYIAAMNNHAWYAAAHAIHRLQQMGTTQDELAALTSDEPPADAESAYRLASKLTAHPHLITDADIARVREQYSDHETAQIVHVICMANLFDRFTKALGLPVEAGIAVQPPAVE